MFDKLRLALLVAFAISRLASAVSPSPAAPVAQTPTPQPVVQQTPAPQPQPVAQQTPVPTPTPGNGAPVFDANGVVDCDDSVNYSYCGQFHDGNSPDDYPVSGEPTEEASLPATSPCDTLLPYDYWNDLDILRSGCGVATY